jgi:hypothetical protein
MKDPIGCIQPPREIHSGDRYIEVLEEIVLTSRAVGHEDIVLTIPQHVRHSQFDTSGYPQLRIVDNLTLSYIQPEFALVAYSCSNYVLLDPLQRPSLRRLCIFILLHHRSSVEGLVVQILHVFLEIQAIDLECIALKPSEHKTLAIWKPRWIETSGDQMSNRGDPPSCSIRQVHIERAFSAGAKRDPSTIR